MDVSLSESQIFYGHIGSMAYTRSELNEVSAVMAVYYLFNGTSFVSSHDYQILHLGRHLNNIKGEEFDSKHEEADLSFLSALSTTRDSGRLSLNKSPFMTILKNIILAILQSVQSRTNS